MTAPRTKWLWHVQMLLPHLILTGARQARSHMHIGAQSCTDSTAALASLAELTWEVSDLYQRSPGSERGLVLSTEPVVALCCQCSSDNRSRADCTTASKGSTDFL